MNIIQKTTTLLVTLFLFASCATVNVKTDYDSQTDFTKYKTFAFYKKGIDKATISDLDKRRILRAIETNLKAKGLTVSKNPDFLVSIFAKSTKHVNVYNNNRYYPRYYGSYYHNNVSRYTQGTLMIDFIDTDGKKLLWQGVGVGALNTSGKVEKKEARIQEFVGEIMEEFPPVK
ncbi:MAG: DUF4136 domain-containing protein [Flavobacteriaceae bacterium]